MLITPVFKKPRKNLLSELLGDLENKEELHKGVYLVKTFSFQEMILNKVEQWVIPDIVKQRLVKTYGVCDDYQQVLKLYKPYVNSKTRKFVISLTEIRKANQPKEGGWRWHKWGPYIGKKRPKHEYLYDEDDSIQSVYTYHIFEVLTTWTLSLPKQH